MSTVSAPSSGGSTPGAPELAGTRTSRWRTVGPLLAILVIVATAGRWYSASRLFDPSSPDAGHLSGDEVAYLLLGDRLLYEGRYTTRGIEQLPGFELAGRAPYLQAPLFKHPPLFPALIGLSRFAGGGGLAAAFVPNLAFSAISIVVMFLLACELDLGHQKALLCAALMAVSPVHWICSARIWLDMPLLTFALAATWAQVKGLREPSWLSLSGFFWGCAALTKYVALVAWLGASVAMLVGASSAVRSRLFWIGQGLMLSMVAAWLFVRWHFEGASVVMFWRSSINDWRMLTTALRSLWLLPVVAAVLIVVWRRLESERFHRNCELLALPVATLLALGLFRIFGWSFLEIPVTSWSPNRLADSSRAFYLARQVLFEPVCWVGIIALLLPLRSLGRPGWTVIQLTWVCLFVFLTCWGNFQLRYGVILTPWEYLGAAALLRLPHGEGLDRSTAATAISACWLALTVARSLWIVLKLAMAPAFFYF
jgi:4-amino-4-deoxy-L-arabinose transferase-like glycosyltransferase